MVSAGLLSSVFAIAIIIPSFTVMARRLHDTNRTMVLAIVSHISGFIAMVATIVFIVGVLAVASSGSGGMIGATLLAGAFGAVVAGVIALYTLYVLVITGNRELNNYGSGGSCEIDPQAHTH
ncbi:MAG: DUF805 domain-containing protein [Staphylococcus equorum]|nr:DUF805 domain-containing protein [Staphylococcus equorum]